MPREVCEEHLGSSMAMDLQISTGVSFDSNKIIVKINQWTAGNNHKIVLFVSLLGLWKYTVEDYKVNTKFGVCCVHASPSQCRGLVLGVDCRCGVQEGRKMLLEEEMLLHSAPAFPVNGGWN